MLNYCAFHIRIWSDKRFRKLPTADEQAIFIYLFTNEQATNCGIYELDFDLMKRVKTTIKIEDAFKNVVDSGLVRWDSETEMVFVIGKFKNIHTRSSKVIFGVIEELNKIKHPFKQEFLKIYKDEMSPYLFRLADYKISNEEMLGEVPLQSLYKLYDGNKKRIKEFLLNRNIAEIRIDQILEDMQNRKLLPLLK